MSRSHIVCSGKLIGSQTSWGTHEKERDAIMSTNKKTTRGTLIKS